MYLRKMIYGSTISYDLIRNCVLPALTKHLDKAHSWDAQVHVNTVRGETEAVSCQLPLRVCCMVKIQTTLNTQRIICC